jgi:hypothetical protein
VRFTGLCDEEAYHRKKVDYADGADCQTGHRKLSTGVGKFVVMTFHGKIQVSDTRVDLL